MVRTKEEITKELRIGDTYFKSLETNGGNLFTIH